MISSEEALTRLREGNHRFQEDRPEHLVNTTGERRAQLTGGQAPFAVILGCSDSRVPAELVFDQGLGDLFVIRVAGNIACASQIGSVEFAVEQFGTPLVVVLGHSNCGAIKATLEALAHPGETEVSPALAFIVEQITPALQPLAGEQGQSGDAQLQAGIRANIEASVAQLYGDSEVLRRRVDTGSLQIIGAEYSLESGAVTFLD